MYYFGTGLASAGHYFHRLEGNRIEFTRDVSFGDLPFNPEETLVGYSYMKPGSHWKYGEVFFQVVGGYSVLSIAGSCYDHRTGTKTVFFVKEEMTRSEMVTRLAGIPAALKIIGQMEEKYGPVDWSVKPGLE